MPVSVPGIIAPTWDEFLALEARVAALEAQRKRPLDEVEELKTLFAEQEEELNELSARMERIEDACQPARQSH